MYNIKYIHIHRVDSGTPTIPEGGAPRFSLYKIVLHFKVSLWESIILLVPLPICKAYPVAILLHGHCAIYARPLTPHCLAMHHTILVMKKSCIGQSTVRHTYYHCFYHHFYY